MRLRSSGAPPTRLLLGRTGVKLSRLGMGTGSINGQIQRDLGQEGFTRLLHYAYDHGITYIDTAENYKTHGMVREAIKESHARSSTFRPRCRSGPST